MNLPNKITLTRIFLIPLMMFFYLATFVPFGKLIAAIIFIIAASTDFLDGKIARSRGLVTDLGKFLDPIADKVLTLAALALVVADGTLIAPVGAIVLIIIIGRELIISAFRQIAATKNFVMAADKWGKLKTVFQDIALPVLMVEAFLISEITNKIVLDVFFYLGLVLIGIATILTIYSGINYVVKNKSVLKPKEDNNNVAEDK